MPETKYLISGQAVRVVTVYFYVELQLEQIYIIVGTMKIYKKLRYIEKVVLLTKGMVDQQKSEG